MIVMVPLRAVLGATIILSAACAASGVRAEDASPWQRDAHSAVRLLAGSRSGAVLLGGVAIQLQQSGIPIGGRPATPACRHGLIFPNRTISRL